MKKSILLVAAVFGTAVAQAQVQEAKPIPQITVTGEGKVKATPDQARISVSVETRGANATDVKEQNDAATEKVVQFLKKFNLPKADVQTQRVSLNPQYDYDKKKYSHVATQTIEIFLRNLDQYDSLMGGLTDSGINRINFVTFETSKAEQFKSEARKLAMIEAKRKADDYVSVLGQKVGKAFTINDMQVHFPQPVMYMAKTEMAADSGTRETLAVGEIEISANVSVSFVLD